MPPISTFPRDGDSRKSNTAATAKPPRRSRRLDGPCSTDTRACHARLVALSGARVTRFVFPRNVALSFAAVVARAEINRWGNVRRGNGAMERAPQPRNVTDPRTRARAAVANANNSRDNS